MKKYSLSILVFLFIALMSMSAFAETYMDVVLQSYDPYPAEPGSYVTLKFKATNRGSKIAPDFTVKFVPTYPFSLDANEVVEKSYGAVDPTDDVAFEYKVRIDEQAVIGENEFSLEYTNDGNQWDDKDFKALIKITEAVLNVKDISMSPDMFAPGGKSSLDITIENLAGTSLKDVSVKLDLATETSAATGTVVSDLPFAPVYSTTEKKIRYLNGGASKTFSFDLMTYPDAESELYKLPIIITYTDESGNTFSKTDLVGIVVGAEPKLTTLIESSEIRSAGGSGEVVIKIINKGVTNVKFLNVKLLESEAFKLLAESNEVYVGNLDSDDYDTAAFRISLNADSSEEVVLPVEIEYMDANNQPYVESVDVKLNILSASDIGESQSNPGATVGVVIVVVLVIGFFIWRRKKKKRRHD